MLNVEPGESIVVTYTDTKDATVQVVKNTIGGNDTFDFDGTGLLPTDLDITTIGGTGSSPVFTFPGLPANGEAASITELLANLPAGWTFSNLQVSGADDSLITATTATLNVEPGENIIVTYTNIKDAPITIIKNAIGGNDTFNFDGTGVLPSSIVIPTVGGTGSQGFTFHGLPASGVPASVTEPLLNLPPGWNFTSLQVTGDDDSSISGPTAGLNVEPGENIVITYTDTKNATVLVQKFTIGGNATFQFESGGDLRGMDGIPDL